MPFEHLTLKPFTCTYALIVDSDLCSIDNIVKYYVQRTLTIYKKIRKN